MVTRREEEAAVLVPVAEWRRLQRSARPTLKELLLAEAPRAEIELPRGSTREAAEAAALADVAVQRAMDGKAPRRLIVVPDKIVNVVV